MRALTRPDARIWLVRAAAAAAGAAVLSAAAAVGASLPASAASGCHLVGGWCISAYPAPAGPPPAKSTPAKPAVASTESAPAPGGGLSIKVSGDRFVDASGETVQLRGVNRPGTEYSCVSSTPAFTSSDNGSDGRSLAYADAVVSSLLSWNKPGASTNAVNAVRIPLNEDCWLGINGAPAAFSGASYQAFVSREVADLTAAGIYSILDLHWAAPGANLATYQFIAPDADHSIAFWTSVASTFASNPAVIFDLFNEPQISCGTAACQSDYSTLLATNYGCYVRGCVYPITSSDQVPSRYDGSSFTIAGTQTLLDGIRGAGADNVVLIEGLGYGNALDQWGQHVPTDPAGNLAPEYHSYPSSGSTLMNDGSLLQSAGITGHYPLVVGEFGEDMCNGTSSGFAQQTMTTADQSGDSWIAWGWDSGEGCGGPSLVSADAGAPDAYGSLVRARLQADER